MFIRNTWYIAAWSTEIGYGDLLARRVCNDPVVIFRSADGKIGAVEDRCCHRGVPLAKGKVTDKGLQCGYHGLVFDHGGKCIEIPGQDKVPERAQVRGYPILERDEFVWIWMGDPAKADPSLVIEYPYRGDYSNWKPEHDVHHVQANHMLLLDNLMDLTHLAYVHHTTIGGNDPMYHFEAKMETTPTNSGLKYVRWLLNSVPPPHYVKAFGFGGRVDRWQEFEFILPCNVIHWSGAVDVGKGAYEHGNRNAGYSVRSYHGITPETDRTSFYFRLRSTPNYPRADPATIQQMPKVPTAGASPDRAIVLEDIEIVEAQQKRLDDRGEAGLIDIATDGARLLMRRAFERRLAEEAGAAE